MASTTLPPELKAAGLQTFATRAAQLRNARPIAAYWIKYQILQVILSKQLHTTSDAAQEYAIALMDELESFKSAHSTEDAIVDDVAAKAYMENFALETFEVGDRMQREGRSERRTVDAFQAAICFMDVLAIWGQVEEEWVKRAKYAKFHAVRIAKALKAGEDPNATNPVVEEPPVKLSDEAEVERELDEMSGQAYRAPTVQDEMDTSHSRELDPVSPIEPAENATRQDSIGGGYFPSVPQGTSDDTTMSDINTLNPAFLPDTQPMPHHQDSQSTVEAFYSSHSDANPLETATSPVGITPTPPFTSSVQTPAATTPPFNSFPPTQPVQPQIPAATPRAAAFMPQPQRQQATVPAPAIATPQRSVNGNFIATSYRTDDEAVLAAQKHAKWAISALNFEDVDTAVKELRIALGALGASGV
ncbi:hypothetical protein LTR62_006523 [Meristemomyces frigidus]|uniref:DUF605-domain-containing protein n=1 Tax=Meristemomyces frigidus TaxID=1508187 RepID=A0AAN7TDD0_9PEZI|nr:hypothetical protein LTR62_006523 [Meristemomyces frigidus]